MRSENTILEIQVEIDSLIKDLDNRIVSLYDKYTVNKQIPRLPPFEKLKEDRVRYECIRVLTGCVDEINDVKLRVSLLQKNLMKYQGFQPSSKTDYLVVSKFKESLKNHIDALDGYRFDLGDLTRNANSKIKALEAAQYYDMS